MGFFPAGSMLCELCGQRPGVERKGSCVCLECEKLVRQADRFRAEQVTIPDRDDPSERGTLPAPAHEEDILSTDRGPWSQTYSGVAFYLLSPAPEDVRLRDIAHALALINRFAGHTFIPYSVAEHSVRVSRAVPPEHALAALLHDAAETYTTDIPRPMKLALGPTVRAIEDGIARAIGEHFGVDLAPIHPLIKRADTALLATEARDLMGAPPQPWDLGVDPLPDRIEPWGWEQAEATFIERFMELGGQA